jgi:hypothetical protein
MADIWVHYHDAAGQRHTTLSEHDLHVIEAETVRAAVLKAHAQFPSQQQNLSKIIALLNNSVNPGWSMEGGGMHQGRAFYDGGGGWHIDIDINGEIRFL